MYSYTNIGYGRYKVAARQTQTHGSFYFDRYSFFYSLPDLIIEGVYFRCHIENSKKMTEMIELEDQEELIKNEQDIETAAYKEAFDHFDWNHSGRIPTSVKSTNKFSL